MKRLVAFALRDWRFWCIFFTSKTLWRGKCKCQVVKWNCGWLYGMEWMHCSCCGVHRGCWNEMRGNVVEGRVEIGVMRNERNAVTKWTRMNEATLCTLAIKLLMLYFLLHRWKGWLGCVALGGCAVGEKTASILSKWLWYWLFNIMLLYDFLCGWMLA